MANFKITNPEVKGKLKLLAETASRALQVNSSGELESSTVTTAELGHLSGVTSPIQTQINAKASTTDLSNHVNDLNNPHAVTKEQVGLGNVPNVDATLRANHTGTQLASTISDFAAAAKAAAVADSITDGITDVAPSQNAVFDALALKADLVAGKVPVSQLPSAVMTYEGVWDSATNTPTLANGTGDAGMVYRVTGTASVDFGAGAISFAPGDYVIYSGTVWEKSDGTDAVNSVNGQVGIVVLTKSDVGLGNVDNTSDATKNAAIATLTNKTIDADDNTILDLTTANLKAGVLDTDLSTVSASDDTIPSAKAAKAYIDADGGVESIALDNTTKAVTKQKVNLTDAGTNPSTKLTLPAIADLQIGQVFTISNATATSLSGAGGVFQSDGTTLISTFPAGHRGTFVLVNKSPETWVPSFQMLRLSTGYNAATRTIFNLATPVNANDAATKSYVDSAVAAGAVAGDIAHTTFSAANNQVAAADVTGFAFSAASIRSFKAQVSVSIDATTDLNEVFELTGVQLASGFVLASTSVGDDSGVVFSITSGGQIQYTSQNSAGFVTSKIAFRARVTLV